MKKEVKKQVIFCDHPNCKKEKVVTSAFFEFNGQDFCEEHYLPKMEDQLRENVVKFEKEVQSLLKERASIQARQVEISKAIEQASTEHGIPYGIYSERGWDAFLPEKFTKLHFHKSKSNLSSLTIDKNVQCMINVFENEFCPRINFEDISPGWHGSSC